MGRMSAGALVMEGRAFVAEVARRTGHLQADVADMLQAIGDVIGELVAAGETRTCRV